MDWKLEVVVVPVADVDRAKRFYSEQAGFVVDHDTRINDEMRVAQLTPPGSGCSIVVGTGIVDMPPGSLKGLQQRGEALLNEVSERNRLCVETSKRFLILNRLPPKMKFGQHLCNLCVR